MKRLEIRKEWDLMSIHKWFLFWHWLKGFEPDALYDYMITGDLTHLEQPFIPFNKWYKKNYKDNKKENGLFGSN